MWMAIIAVSIFAFLKRKQKKMSKNLNSKFNKHQPDHEKMKKCDD